VGIPREETKTSNLRNMVEVTERREILKKKKFWVENAWSFRNKRRFLMIFNSKKPCV
jgi:hypothetical protein